MPKDQPEWMAPSLDALSDEENAQELGSGVFDKYMPHGTEKYVSRVEHTVSTEIQCAQCKKPGFNFVQQTDPMGPWLCIPCFKLSLTESAPSPSEPPPAGA